MKMIRFHETPDHGSRFEELEITFPQPTLDVFGNTLHFTRSFEANGVIADLPEGLVQDWHVAPERQLVIVLMGRIEVETTDGEIRQWKPGEMFMADDTSGQGHRTRVLDGPAKVMFLRVIEGFDPAQWASS